MHNAIRSEVRQLDSAMPIYELKTLQAQLDETLLTDRLIALLSAGFGLPGLPAPWARFLTPRVRGGQSTARVPYDPRQRPGALDLSPARGRRRLPDRQQ